MHNILATANFKNLIKDYATILTLPRIDNSLINSQKLGKFFVNATKHYIKFRLDLMTNPDIQKVEKQIILSAARAGVKYATSQAGLTLTNDEVNKIVDTVFPELLGLMNNKRIDLFTRGLVNLNNYLNKEQK